jgi:hypothetical protein
MAKNKEAKEKPLDKLTAKELREMALAMDAGIVGVHAMNKAELISAVKEAKRKLRRRTSMSAVLKEKSRNCRRKGARPKQREIAN